MNKRGEESTTSFYEIIMGIMIVTILVVIAFSFVANNGSANASFLPAYVRDVGNIIEGMASTSADISVVYEFEDELRLDYNDHKISLSGDDGIRARKIYLPDDVTINVLNGNFSSRFVLLHKKGKKYTIGTIGKGDDDSETLTLRVDDAILTCGDKQEVLFVNTTIPDVKLQEALELYPPASGSRSILLETYSTGATNTNEVIIYYNKVQNLDDLLCRLSSELTSKFSITPVLIPTLEPNLLDNHDIVLSFSQFPYVASAITALLEESQGDARG